MSSTVDISGLRFGKLVAVRQMKSDKYGAAMWKCQCDCGDDTTVRGVSLRNGDIQSCGCSKKKVRDKRAYVLWRAMVEYCNPLFSNKRDNNTLCRQWTKFETFYADMGVRPVGAIIHRIDSKKSFTPANCRWATHHASIISRDS